MAKGKAASKGKGGGKARGTGEGLKSAPATPRESRARAPEAPPIEDRVRLILNDMANGTWSMARALEYASAWGLSLSTVQDASAEAGRYAKGIIGAPEEIRAKLTGHLEEAIVLARLDPMPAMAAKAIVSAVAEFAKLWGVVAPTKIAQTDAAGADLPPEVLALLTRPQAAAFVALPIDPVPPKE